MTKHTPDLHFTKGYERSGFVLSKNPNFFKP